MIFDLDDTLVEDIRTVESSYEHVRRCLSGDRDGASWHDMRDAVRMVWRRGPCYELCVGLGFASSEGLWSMFEGNDPILDEVKDWLPSFRREAWTAALEILGLRDPALISAAGEIFGQAEARGHPILPGAAESVRRVSARHRLGLLTNGPSDVQRHKLEGSGLASHFERVAISGEMGVGKPDPAAFRHILGSLEVEPHEAVMIGDNWERDIVGARSSGIPAVWIAWGRPAPAQLEGVTVIETIEALPGVLD